MTRSIYRFVIRLWPAFVPPVLLLLFGPVRDDAAMSLLAGAAVSDQDKMLAMVYMAAYLGTLTLTPIMILRALIETILVSIEQIPGRAQQRETLEGRAA